MGLNKSTLSEQIYQILRNDILTQKIPCGEKLTLYVCSHLFFFIIFLSLFIRFRYLYFSGVM